MISPQGKICLRVFFQGLISSEKILTFTAIIITGNNTTSTGMRIMNMMTYDFFELFHNFWPTKYTDRNPGNIVRESDK